MGGSTLSDDRRTGRFVSLVVSGGKAPQLVLYPLPTSHEVASATA